MTRRSATDVPARTWVWGLAALTALWWPGRVSGPLDGAPLDGNLEALALGLILPALWWFHSGFLRRPLARITIAALVLVKVGGAFLAQDGWCVRFDPRAPIVRDGTGRPHSWDVRADWRSPDPTCSAIVTREYSGFKQFPVWFFNLPPADDNLPGPDDRPPNTTVDMTVVGFLDARTSGTLDVEVGPGMDMTLLVDGRPADHADAVTHRIELDSGLHFVQATVTMTGNRWRFLPSWNQAGFGASGFPTSTTTRPGRLDARPLRRAAGWLTTSLAALLVGGWLVSALFAVRHWITIAWIVVAAVWLAYVAPRAGNDFVTSDLARWSIAALACAALVPMPERLRTLRGAFLLVGIPWLVFIGMVSFDHVGKFSLYSAGDDWWTFQRFAYRIFLQGYWLEGGQVTFWFQPLYRWIAGGFHMVFGDSSIGEFFWDGACLLAIALFAHDVTSRVAGFRWGIVAAAVSLTMVMHGPTWGHFGVGLSENAAAGFIYMAALTALGARATPAMIAAGLLATLGFYTRLNSLPIALAVALFALPLTITVRDVLRPGRWPARAAVRRAAFVVAIVVTGVGLFALRTWYYTGVLSVFHGTQFNTLSVWQPGLSILEVMERMIGSALMVLTMNDPPRFAWYAIPMIAAAVFSVGAVAGVKGLRDLPLPLVLFFLAGCSGSFVARGTAYSGRFSTILIGAASAVTMCVAARVVAAWRPSLRLEAGGKPSATLPQAR